VSGSALSVRNLSITFGADTTVATVVDRISFELCPGEIVGLVGESGCGKSLTAAALMGLLPAPPARMRAEHIRLGDKDLLQLDEPGMRRIRGSEMSMIFQEPLTALDPVFTIGRQLSFVIRRHRGAGRKQAQDISLEMLGRVGIADADRIMKSYPHQLSGGMRQRVMIAMALVCRPRVLVADEPTTALDVTTQAQVLAQLTDLGRDSDTAILLITHDLGVVAQTCDRALVMYCGRIIEEAPVAELFSHPAHPYTAGLLAAVPRVSREAATPVRAIPGSVPHPASLPSGCHFVDRCERAENKCRRRQPRLLDLEGRPAPKGHRRACHNPLSPGKTGISP
jgi:oligopeptide/dipeptide ABC transporter ATP-binding protein